ncbi:MAG: VWD domain-containing protein, partial [Proteobacteria bacterium]|nr:VWD domain-containing protein [Pseudomonadota bacterium]
AGGSVVAGTITLAPSALGSFVQTITLTTTDTTPSGDTIILQTDTITVSANVVTPNGSGTGDVHMATFSGLKYDFQAVGDFVLERSLVPGNSMLVQITTSPANPGESLTTKVAAQVGSDIITVATGRDSMVWLNGAPDAALSAANPIELLSGGKIQRTGATSFKITWLTGETLTITNPGTFRGVSYLNTSLALALDTAPGSVQGLLGSYTGKQNDFQLPDGTVLAQPLSHATLLGRFADAWRVTAADSLLDEAMNAQKFAARMAAEAAAAEAVAAAQAAAAAEAAAAAQAAAEAAAAAASPPTAEATAPEAATPPVQTEGETPVTPAGSGTQTANTAATTPEAGTPPTQTAGETPATPPNSGGTQAVDAGATPPEAGTPPVQSAGDTPVTPPNSGGTQVVDAGATPPTAEIPPAQSAGDTPVTPPSSGGVQVVDAGATAPEAGTPPTSTAGETPATPPNSGGVQVVDAGATAPVTEAPPAQTAGETPVTLPNSGGTQVVDAGATTPVQPAGDTPATPPSGAPQAADASAQPSGAAEPATVTALTQNAFGFHAQFSAPVEADITDVALTGDLVGVVSGTIVFDADRRGLTFVHDGKLASDTYHVGLNGGAALDGDGDGTGGDAYATSFVWARQADSHGPTLVTLPEGIGAAAEPKAPAGSRLPVTLQNDGSATSAVLSATFNPAQITIDGVGPGADLPDGASINAEVQPAAAGDLTTIRIAISSQTPLPAGPAQVVTLSANVRSQAPSDGEALLLTLEQLNGAPITSGLNGALHVLGATAGQGIDGPAAQRSVGATGTAFAAWQGLDPKALASLVGNSQIVIPSSSGVHRAKPAMPKPETPPVPVQVRIQQAEPALTAPDDLTGQPDGSIEVPLLLSDAAGVVGARITVAVDPAHLDLQSVAAGPLGQGAALTVVQDGGAVTIEVRRTEPMAGGSGALALLTYRIADLAIPALVVDVTAVLARGARDGTRRNAAKPERPAIEIDLDLTPPADMGAPDAAQRGNWRSRLLGGIGKKPRAPTQSRSL